MKTNPIKFGTDGWRGIIAQDFTFDNVRLCAQAVADYSKQSGLARRGLIIGYDTRFASEDFAAAAAEVVAANGIKVYLCPKATPTPVLSYGVKAQQAGGAIIITASHNPARWNGFKVKSEFGASATDETTAEIEKNIAHILTSGEIKQMPLAQALETGLVEYLDLAPIYYQHISELINLNELRQSHLKVVIDSMHGAGSGYLKTLLDDGMIKVTEINGDRNPLFPGIQPEPIVANLARLSSTIREQGADVGLATDGDADRLGVMDEKGTFLTTLQVFALLCLYLLEVRGERGLIVKTISTTAMLDRLGEIFNVPVRHTAVGFKYIAPFMLADNALIGGEESGGFGFRGHVPERDGILSALYFLDLMVKTGKKPSELIEYLYSRVGAHHFNRVDVKFPASERQTIIERIKHNYPQYIDGVKVDVNFPELEHQTITERIKHNRPQYIDGVKVVKFDTTDGFRYILADGSWLLIRFSGTEPLLRLYAESNTPARVAQILKLGKELVGV